MTAKTKNPQKAGFGLRFLAPLAVSIALAVVLGPAPAQANSAAAFKDRSQ